MIRNILAQIITSPDEIGLPGVEASDSFFADTVVPTAAVIATLVSIVVIIIGGLRFVTGAGNPEQVKKARDTIMYGLIGLLVVFLSVTIVSLIAGAL